MFVPTAQFDRLSAILLLIALPLMASGCDRESYRLESRAAPEPGVAEMDEEAEIIYFLDEGCPDCEIVREELLPQLLDQLGLSPESVRRLDVAEPGTLREFIRLEKELGFQSNLLAPVLILRGKPYCGLEEIRRAVEQLREESNVGLEYRSPRLHVGGSRRHLKICGFEPTRSAPRSFDLSSSPGERSESRRSES